MKRYFICIAFVWGLTACTTEDKKIPKDIMPVNKMKIIVWDMMQAGAYANYLKESDTTIKNINTGYFIEVLKLHNVNKNDFFKSFSFYQQHPVLNKELFDSVNTYAQSLRNSMYKRHQ